MSYSCPKCPFGKGRWFWQSTAPAALAAGPNWLSHFLDYIFATFPPNILSFLSSFLTTDLRSSSSFSTTHLLLPSRPPSCRIPRPLGPLSAYIPPPPLQLIRDGHGTRHRRFCRGLCCSSRHKPRSNICFRRLRYHQWHLSRSTHLWSFDARGLSSRLQKAPTCCSLS